MNLDFGQVKWLNPGQLQFEIALDLVFFTGQKAKFTITHIQGIALGLVLGHKAKY